MTNPGGFYEFFGLDEGEYIVQVDSSNFGFGGPLSGTDNSTPTFEPDAEQEW